VKKSLYLKEYKALINELYAIRIENGLRQVDLANKLKVPQSFVSKYESGERRLDIIETMEICRSLGISIIELLERMQNVAPEK
jgi:transcriptional regulator with XRE-family HTH domain